MCRSLCKREHSHAFGELFFLRHRHHHIVHHIEGISGESWNAAFAELFSLSTTQETFDIDAKIGSKGGISICIFVTLHLRIGELTILQKLRCLLATLIEHSTTMLVDEVLGIAIKIEILLKTGHKFRRIS